MFVGAFFCALAFYLEFVTIAYVLFVFSSILVPALALTDRIKFNGKRIYRAGLLPKAWAYFTHSRFWLKARDIEQVETTVSPVFKRGGRVYFRYKTHIRGKGMQFSILSGGGDFGRFVRTLFRDLPEEVLDAGSLEVRDYYGEHRNARTLARKSDIPPADVLEHAFKSSRFGRPRREAETVRAEAGPETERAGSLRLLGNQLRLSGALLQALESFRRAASLKPDDGWLLFDFARCIHSFAGSEGDVRLERKAAAMLRLAERRAGNDGLLLARVGEGYFQLGEWRRAGIAFRKAVDSVGEHFRSIRGMAEIALRDGKLAHVVHNFSTASRLAESAAARRWSLAEADYFSRLSNDEEYLEMELGRVNLLNALDRWRRTTLRLCLVGFPFIGLGLYFEDRTTANCGWILSGGMLILWTSITVGRRLFTPRIAPELLQED